MLHTRNTQHTCRHTYETNSVQSKTLSAHKSAHHKLAVLRGRVSTAFRCIHCTLAQLEYSPHTKGTQPECIGLVHSHTQTHTYYAIQTRHGQGPRARHTLYLHEHLSMRALCSTMPYTIWNIRYGTYVQTEMLMEMQRITCSWSLSTSSLSSIFMPLNVSCVCTCKKTSTQIICPDAFSQIHTRGTFSGKRPHNQQCMWVFSDE